MTTRRGFVGGILALIALPAMRSSGQSTSDPSSSTPSIEEARQAMCLEIRTDPDVARDQAIFVDRWRRELGRIINIGGDSQSRHGAGVVERERPPPSA